MIRACALRAMHDAFSGDDALGSLSRARDVGVRHEEQAARRHCLAHDGDARQIFIF